MGQTLSYISVRVCVAMRLKTYICRFSKLEDITIPTCENVAGSHQLSTLEAEFRSRWLTLNVLAST